MTSRAVREGSSSLIRDLLWLWDDGATAALPGRRRRDRRQHRGDAEDDDEAVVERRRDQFGEEVLAGEEGAALVGDRAERAFDREQVVDRVDAEEGGEERRDRRQGGDVVRDGRFDPVGGQPAGE